MVMGKELTNFISTFIFKAQKRIKKLSFEREVSLTQSSYSVGEPCFNSIEAFQHHLSPQSCLLNNRK